VEIVRKSSGIEKSKALARGHLDEAVSMVTGARTALILSDETVGVQDASSQYG